MKRLFTICTMSLLASSGVLASEAETSAAAGSDSRHRNGTAQATARYEGDTGFARTDSRSGRINLARGVAVGVDEDGISLSVSHAVAPRVGPALASNFNLSIGRDGEVATSGGVSVADGPIHREANAGGSAGTHRSRPTAVSTAGGRTDAYGHVTATTRADTSRARAGKAPRRTVRVTRPHSDVRRVVVRRSDDDRRRGAVRVRIRAHR